jgi:hypothetical protein
VRGRVRSFCDARHYRTVERASREVADQHLTAPDWGHYATYGPVDRLPYSALGIDGLDVIALPVPDR